MSVVEAAGLVMVRTASGSSYALEGQRVIRVRDGLPAERYRLISLDRRLRYTDGEQIWTTTEVVDRGVR